MFNSKDQGSWTDLGQGVSRKVSIYNEEVMMVQVKFATGSIGAVHHHPHTQITYVLEGVFEFSIGNEVKQIAKGDSCLMPTNIPHGCVCIEKGELLDVFSPHREDFI